MSKGATHCSTKKPTHATHCRPICLKALLIAQPTNLPTLHTVDLYRLQQALQEFTLIFFTTLMFINYISNKL